MIRAIIFDFGRVISAQKPESLFRQYEIDLGLRAGTINTIMFESQAWSDALIGGISEAELWTAVGPELGLNTPDAIDAFRRRYRSDEAVNEGVLSVIRQLQGRFKLAVLSNSPAGLADWLNRWNLDRLFDVLFCSGDEGVAKPDPRAYEQTLDRLTVEAHEAVFVDDTLENVLVAQNLGMHGIHFTTSTALAKDLRLQGIRVEPNGSGHGLKVSGQKRRQSDLSK
jgi:epoxide hydrolase-like predicted phosphatase